MAVQAKLLAFDLTSGTGNLAVTGVGFQPQLIIFFCDWQTAIGQSNGMNHCIGAGVSSSSRWVVWSEIADGGTDATGHELLTNQVLARGPNPASNGRADLVSMDSDGFTLNRGVSFGSTYKAWALCLAGLDGAAVGVLPLGTTTGSKSVTGLAFQPDVLMTFMFGYHRLSASPTEYNGGGLGFGFTDGVTSLVAASQAYYNAGAVKSSSLVRDSTIYAQLNWNTDAVSSRATFTSFNSDGFTINQVTSDGSNQSLPYITLKSGGQVKVGSFDTQTTVTTFDVTAGFNPKVVVAAGSMQTSAFETSPSATGQFSFGVAAGSDQMSYWYEDEDALTNHDIARRNSTTRFLLNWDRTGADTFAAEGEISVNSLTTPSDGFRLSQDDADPTANKIIYFALGDAPGGAGKLSGLLAGKLGGKLIGKAA